MPVLNPAEIWQRSGPLRRIDELFKLKDRKGADMVLAMTHEEIVTTHVAQVVRSYRDLPLILYHFQTKERDEPRPRAGVLRTREFIMKDSYTFDRDAAGLDVGYEKHREAYDRIFDRCGLEWYRVESDVGMMGGTGAHEYMAPCPAGENDVALAPGYAANVEVATRRRRSRSSCPTALDAPRGGLDAGADDGRAGRRRRSACPPGALIKAYPVIVGERRAAARARARRPPRQRHQARATRSARPFRPAHEAEFAERIGPGGLHRPGRHRRADPARRRARRRRATSPAPTSADAHLRGVKPGRDFPFTRVDVRTRRGGRHRRRPPDPDRARDRDRQHLQARHALLGAARRDLPGRGRHVAARSGWAPTASARRASPPPRSSSSPTRRASRGRARSRRSTCTWSGSASRAPRSTRSPSGSTTSCASSASTSSTTTATPARAEKFADAELLGVPAAADGRRRTLERGRDRGPGPARARDALASRSRGRRRPPRSCGRRSRRNAQADVPAAVGARPLRPAAAGDASRARRCARGRSRTRSATSGWR